MEDELLDCWLCGANADNWELTVARVCRGCYGDSNARLERAGFRIEATDPSSGDHMIAVIAPRGREPLVGIIFGPETLKTQIKKIFLSEVQVGNRRFDDKVYLEFADKSDLPLLMGVEIEDLMIELVKDGIVHVIGDHADVHVHSNKRAHTDEQLALLCASLLNAVWERKRAIP